jgi:hypothetical protein
VSDIHQTLLEAVNSQITSAHESSVGENRSCARIPATCSAHGSCIYITRRENSYVRIERFQASSILILNSRFGGTDCQYHYNDTWVFDTNNATWSELTCIGYMPSPREGHAAALVDDVMYVFGGRGVDGKDMGDLVAFKLSSGLTSNLDLT